MDSDRLPGLAAVPVLPRRFTRSFAWRVGWRLAASAVLLASAVWALMPPSLPAAGAVFATATLLVGAGLWREVRRTNMELARLLHALRNADGTARFDAADGDTGFAELAAAIEALLECPHAAMLAERRRAAELLAVLEHVPMPLLAVDDASCVSLLNHAARRLFGPHTRAQVADFAVFGTELAALLESRGPASATVALRPPHDAGTRLRVARSEALLGGRPQRLFAFQPIQTELDESEARLASSLVRVLTHEVMNSLTPVSSLLRTASDLGERLADGRSDPLALARLNQALATAARRSEGLLGFVERYRALARPLEVRKAPLDTAVLAESLSLLFRAEWPETQPTLELRLPPDMPPLCADRELIEPVLLNLLRNAAQATLGHAAVPLVRFTVQRAPSGRMLIDIEDNGPGIAPALRDEVFLPFFTTKPGGHGVGLALARQTVLAHGGSIHADTSPELGGARLRIALHS
jgi:two-component system, NtrC family, nitrogen regulation sensor histidine kinase NtrY